MKFGLSKQTLEKIEGVFAKHPEIEQVILYGSRARGHYKNGSDIDLTFVGNAALTHFSLNQVMDEIDDLLLPYSFDYSLLNQIEDPDLLAHIQNVGVLFYQQKQHTSAPVEVMA